MSRADRPHPGSALAKVLGPRPAMPPFVMLPEAMAPERPRAVRPARRVPRRGVRPVPDQQRPEPARLLARRPRPGPELTAAPARATAVPCSTPSAPHCAEPAAIRPRHGRLLRRGPSTCSPRPPRSAPSTSPPSPPRPATATAGTSSASRSCWPGGWSRRASGWSTSTGSATTTARGARATTPTATTSTGRRTSCSRRPTPPSPR